MQKHRRIIEQLLAETGVRIDGPDPWDIQVRDGRFFDRVLSDGSLGLGESYMEGWWDCPRLDAFICRLLKGNLEEKIRAKSPNIAVLPFRPDLQSPVTGPGGDYRPEALRSRE